MLKRIFAAALMALAALMPAPASAQSVTPGLTPGCSSPPPAFGVVWTASQWIVCLTSLQPFLGYIPLNAGGGAMSGELTLSPSVTTNAPLNFQLGVAPTSPANGDFWFTSAGPFYRAGGVTVGPLASSVSQTFSNPTFTGTVTLPSGATFTSAGGQGFAHLYVNRTTDAGGAQVLQVQGNGYISGGLSLGTTTSYSSGLLAVSSAGGEFSLFQNTASSSENRVRFDSTQTTSGTAIQLSNSGNNNQISLRLDSGGNLAFYTGQTAGASSGSGARAFQMGTGGADFLTSVGGASGGTLTTNAGTLTLSSGGGATTTLSDTTIKLSSGVYASCGVLGTSSNNIVCSSPSSFITYNDNVTSDPGPAVTGNLYCMNTGSGALNLTLPASPANGAYVGFSDCGGNFAVHNLTIVNNGSNIMFNAGNMIVSTRYAGAVLRYSSGQTSWILSPL